MRHQQQPHEDWLTQELRGPRVARGKELKHLENDLQQEMNGMI